MVSEGRIFNDRNPKEQQWSSSNENSKETLNDAIKELNVDLDTVRTPKHYGQEDIYAEMSRQNNNTEMNGVEDKIMKTDEYYIAFDTCNQLRK